MGKCPKCNKNSSPKSTRCDHCGAALKPDAGAKDAAGTLDVAREFPAGDEPSEKEATGSPAVPPVRKTEAESKPAAETPPAQKAADPGKGTLGTPEIPAETEQPAAAGSGADDMAGSTVNLAIPTPGQTKVLPENTDDLATLDLGSQADSPNKTERGSVDRTVVRDSASAGGSADAPGKSGSTGRLRRMWERAAGSSANPMHSLKAEGQATDSVFDRVATRTVAKRTDDSEAPDYELMETIGEGAMGIVYSARQKGIGRTVAIKAIKESHRKKDDSRRKFFYEAQITGELDHPNIVPIHELGATDDGMLFYSMKLIGGTEWQKAIAHKSRDENLDILMKIADALAFAHAKRVIHRDIKPENIMLGTYGEVFLTDWGLAVNLERDRSFTLGGTPAYMAPEMAVHKIEDIDTTSDIYLLGGILFQIVTGKPPHTGNTVTEALRAAHRNEFVPVESSDALLDIAYRAMEARPEDRYPTVEVMQEAIRQYRRNAESIALSKRSEELLNEAIRSKDYERFSRTIFGFQDAVELWPENAAATDGIKRARLAYGECAFEKGDYDLCIQTLDQNVKEEAVLYERARKEKALVEGREARFKSLRRVLAAVVLFALVGMTGLSLVAFWQRSEAIAERDNAETARMAETTAKEQAVTARDDAFAARDAETKAKTEAQTARDDALAAKDAETKAKTEAQTARDDALAAKDAETKAKTDAQLARDDALAAKDAETLAKTEAQIARDDAILAKEAETIALKEAELRAAQIEIGNYQSNLALAKAQIEKYDVRSGNEIIAGLKQEEGHRSLTSQGFVPDFRNWGMRRTELLANTDLPSARIDGRVTSMDFAANANIGIAGTEDGRLIVLGMEAGKLVTVNGPAMPAAIDSVAISPGGEEVVFSIAAEGTTSTVYSWNRNSQSQPVAVSTMTQKSIQGLLMTNTHVVGGINGGVYVWDRSPDGTFDEPRVRIRNLRGRLRALQQIDATHALVVSELDQKLELFRLDLIEGDKNTIRIELPGDLANVVSTAAMARSGNQLIIGTVDGRLLVGGPMGENMHEILPVKHQSAIRTIRSNSDGTLLTTADEPVMHLWKPSMDSDGGWVYDTFLIGTSGNVSTAVFAGNSNLVLGAGDNGQIMFWNVERQKQRNRIERIATTGYSLERQIAPASEVLVTSAGDNAKTVDANGVIDVWNPSNGRTALNAAGQRFEYIGHTPGSRFVDMAIDEARGILVTSASLPGTEEPERLYLGAASDHNVEFCLWDTKSGQMLRRWTARSGRLPAISLADNGQLLLIADEAQTRLVSLDNPQSVLDTSADLSRFNAYFSVPHPTNSRQAMLVKSSGAIWMYDFGNPSTGGRFDDLAAEQKLPIRGAWSSDGSRFCLLFADGNVETFDWDGSQITSVSANRRHLELSDYQLKSKWEIDMAITGVGNGQQLVVVTRIPGNPIQTRLASTPIGGSGSGAEWTYNEPVSGRQYLALSEDGQPGFGAGFEGALPIQISEVQGAIRFGDTICAATRSGTVFCVADGRDSPSFVFGRPETLSGDADRSGTKIAILGQDRSVWRVNNEAAGAFEWQPLTIVGSDVRNLDLSPNGQHLLMSGEDADGRPFVQLTDYSSGASIVRMDDVAATLWDKSAPGQMFAGLANGKLEIRDVSGAVVRELPMAKLEAGDKLVGLHEFTEKRSDWQIPNRWLLVHTQSEVAGHIQFVPVESGQEGLVLVATDRKVVGLNLTITTSPVEGLFVSGTTGGVTIWFAVPKLNDTGRELFSLAGHGGADITAIRFDEDGNTLITADSLRRIFGWLAVDPRDNVVAEPLAVNSDAIAAIE